MQDGSERGAAAEPESAAAEGAVPEGFRAMRVAAALPGPVYGRRDPQGFTVGLRVRRGHCNMTPNCQGGVLMTIADVAMGLAANAALGEGAVHNLPTVSLSADFLAPAPLGCWLEGSAYVLRQTRRLSFTEIVLKADGEACLRATAIFKLASAGAQPQSSFETIFNVA